MQAQAVGIRFHPNLDGPARFVRIDIVQGGVWSARRRNDRVNQAVGRRIVPALEAGQVQYGHIGVTGGKFGCPHLLHAVGTEVLWPYIAYFERVLHTSAFQIGSEKAAQPFFVLGDRAHGENGIAQHLEFFQYRVIEAGIGMVGTADHQNGKAIFLFHLLQDHFSPLLHLGVENIHRPPALLHGKIAFVLRDLQTVLKRLEQLLFHHVPLRKRNGRIEISHPFVSKKFTSFVKAALITFGAPATMGQLDESITFCRWVGI